jgi:carboxyl-terminal processing protease
VDDPVFYWSSKLTRVFIALMMPALLASVPAGESPAQQHVDARQQLEEVVGLVEKHFLDVRAVSGEVWQRDVAQARERIHSITDPDQFASTVNGLLATLDTSHTYYFSKGDPRRFQLLGVFNSLYDQSRDDLFVYEGIGIDSRQIDGQTVILSVFDGFPAHRAGLRFGDRIISVDDRAFHPIRSFQGRAGNPVRVRIERQGEQAELMIEVVNLDGRTMFETAAISSIRSIDHVGKKIGYIHLWSYAGIKYQELLRQQILWGDLSQCDALVLDLRDGWGGADLNYLNLFRDPIAVTSFRGRDGVTGSYSGVWEKPVALIVNERSTSGKELFAYGFQKLGIGPVAGSQTAGAVVAGRIFLLSGGDVLYLAVRDITVDGVRLEGRGVKPDIVVDRLPRQAAGNDPQLEKALDTVAKQVD